MFLFISRGACGLTMWLSICFGLREVGFHGLVQTVSEWRHIYLCVNIFVGLLPFSCGKTWKVMVSQRPGTWLRFSMENRYLDILLWPVTSVLVGLNCWAWNSNITADQLPWRSLCIQAPQLGSACTALAVCAGLPPAPGVPLQDSRLWIMKRQRPFCACLGLCFNLGLPDARTSVCAQRVGGPQCFSRDLTGQINSELFSSYLDRWIGKKKQPPAGVQSVLELCLLLCCFIMHNHLNW